MNQKCFQIMSRKYEFLTSSIPQYFLSQQDDSQRSLYCTFFFQVIQEIIEGGVNHSKSQ